MSILKPDETNWYRLQDLQGVGINFPVLCSDLRNRNKVLAIEYLCENIIGHQLLDCKMLITLTDHKLVCLQA